MAALGNLKVVVSFLRSGIDVNGQNKMNGWTALHWACTRGYGQIVETLIRAGADPSIRSKKGERPIDVCKESSVIELFRLCMTDEDVDAALKYGTSAQRQNGGFVPNYIANPDLSKAWDSPDNVAIPEKADSSFMRQQQIEASTATARQPDIIPSDPTSSLPAAAAASYTPSLAPDANNAPTIEREFLVYAEEFNEGCLLGSVFVDDIRSQTVGDLAKQIHQELDKVPTNFSILRHNGQLAVPISTKQELLGIGRVFRGANDAVIVKSNSKE
ncbi:hypothetical protein GGI15_001966 [Coemansia interrupta]|uniref:Ankyrin repeat protein n=1 Tax=Coemansia interrupta TaxID=1126814 RepID=A0A9W8HJB2_9FUNG|nr:hypothetical protein GGI15_001966 [Coemansia interrupta]